jgi:hypothetical protein
VQSCIILFPVLFVRVQGRRGRFVVVLMETKNKSGPVRRRGFQRGTHKVRSYPFVRNVVRASRVNQINLT